MVPLFETATIDRTGCPFVAIIPRKVSGVAILKGTQMPVDGIVDNYLGCSPVEEVAYSFEIPEEGVRSLLLFASAQNSAIKPCE